MNIKNWLDAKKRGMQIVKNLALSSAVVMSVCAVAPAYAQYPEKPITFLVGFPPGTSVDAVARIIGEQLSQDMGQPVIVQNRPGVGGSLAMTELSRAKPDGYTIGLSSTGPLGINPHLLSEVRYDVLNDFIPITQTSWLPYLLVINKSKGLETFEDVVDYAKANPGKLNYASIGTGTTSHLLSELFLQKTGLDIIHIPYSGSAQSQADVIGGSVDMTFDTVVSTSPHVRAGRLSALAVSTANRSKLEPSIPTLQELGVENFNMGAWLGFVTPKGTPPEIVRRLHEDITRILKDPEISEKLEALGTEVLASESPEAFAALVEENYNTLGELIKTVGIERN